MTFLVQYLSEEDGKMKQKQKQKQKRKQLQNTVLPYLQAIPDIMRYQIVSKAVLGILLLGLSTAMRWTLHSTGRVAVSSGDFLFLFTTWQGILLIVMALVTLFLYVAFDLNTMILFSGKRLKQEEFTVWECMKESIEDIR